MKPQGNVVVISQAPAVDSTPDRLEYMVNAQHFRAPAGANINEIAAQAKVPLSVILQVTRRCDLGCSFCSESRDIPDPTLSQLDHLRSQLVGTRRVFLSGGEPLLRNDFVEIVDMFHDFV